MPEQTEGAFDEALAVDVAGDGHLTARIAEGWDVRGNPHGGYLLAVVGAAMGRAVAQPDPLTISATYLAPPRTGPADLHVSVLRAGRRQSTAAVELSQDGLARVHAVATFGRLPDEDPVAWTGDVARPAIPAPEECLAPERLEEIEGEAINLHRRLLLRCHPDTGWLQGAPSGVAELEGWLRFSDGRPPDPYALLMFSDGMPPSLFDVAGRADVGHVPTVQLTTHLFALPADGWVQGRFRTRIQGGSFIDEDGELWDANGRLVATTRQLALVRSPAAS